VNTSKVQRTCPECGSGNVYLRNDSVPPGQTYFLRGLGGFLQFAKYKVVVCGDCGLVRFYAEESALRKLPAASNWRRVDGGP